MKHQLSNDSTTMISKKGTNETSTSPTGRSSESDDYGNDTSSRPSNFSSYADYTSRDVSDEIDQEDKPALSERVATYHDAVNIL